MVTRQEYAFLSKSVYGGQHEQSQPAGWTRDEVNNQTSDLWGL